MSVWKSDEELLIFACLISPSKITLFEKWHQAFDKVFHHQMKHLEVRQKYSAVRRIFNSLVSVSYGDETLRLMLERVWLPAALVRNTYHYSIIKTLTLLSFTTASESGSSCEETGRRACNVSPWINSQGKIPREKANGGDQTQVKGAVIPPQFLLIVLVVEAVTAVLLWILPLPRISGAFKRGHPIVNR